MHASILVAKLYSDKSRFSDNMSESMICQNCSYAITSIVTLCVKHRRRWISILKKYIERIEVVLEFPPLAGTRRLYHLEFYH